MQPETRQCRGCGEEKPSTAFYAKQSRCKACVIQRAQAYYAHNRERVLKNRKACPPPSQKPEARRAKRAAKRGHVNAVKRAWRAANRDHIKALDKAWREANIDRLRAREGHKERIAANARKYRLTDRDKYRRRARSFNRRTEVNLRKQAKEIIHQQAGIPYRAIPKVLLDTKIKHLLAVRLLRDLSGHKKPGRKPML